MNRNSFALIVALVSSMPALAQPPGGGPGGAGGGSGDGIWRRNAYYGEFLTFDSCLGHQPQTGQYHYHVDPVCLRAELNDNLVTLRTGRTGQAYTEQTSGCDFNPRLGPRWLPDLRALRLLENHRRHQSD